MTKLPRTGRFLIDRDLTPQDIEQMEYWCAVRDAETERAIKVVNNWQHLKQQDEKKWNASL